jgi:alpha-galactosidase
MPNAPLSRRTLLSASALAAPAALTLAGGMGLLATGCGFGGRWRRLLASAAWRVFGPDGEPVGGLELERDWKQGGCQVRLRNPSSQPVRVGEVQVFGFAHGLPPETPIYTEGSQMLSQTGGTLGKPESIGYYTDAKHYRLPTPADAFTSYNLLHLQSEEAGNPLFAFTSCHRFQGKFQIRPERLEIALELDGVEIGAGERMDLESFAVFEGRSAAEHYASLAEALRRAHPPIFGGKPPSGWCSWYCFGPSVTAEQVMANLEFIAKEMPALRYIQIDDGYQAAMGDWLETGNAFGGDVRTVLRQIRERGFEPAIWVAPFIAEAGSKVFQAHPEWFMKDADGKPLASNTVTFGGWRRGPWYALDGTHPGARAHLEAVFRTMREEWGVTYFKLDANFWGVMPQGRLHDGKATRIEAYRRGMEAVRRGAGDAFLLGCNHPLWPSLGTVHGSRSSHDIDRSWSRFKQVARENLRRGWQNGRLWWNDPDVVLLLGDLSEDEFEFHAASIYASGGMLLAGDDLPKLPAERLEMLRKLSPPTGQAAEFDADLHIGRVRQGTREWVFVFNWGEQPDPLSILAGGARAASDFFRGTPLAIASDEILLEVPVHGARVVALEHGA